TRPGAGRLRLPRGVPPVHRDRLRLPLDRDVAVRAGGMTAGRNARCGLVQSAHRAVGASRPLEVTDQLPTLPRLPKTSTLPRNPPFVIEKLRVCSSTGI